MNLAIVSLIISSILYISKYICCKGKYLVLIQQQTEAESHYNIFQRIVPARNIFSVFDNPTIWDLLIASKKNVNNFKIVSMNVFLLIYLILVDLMVRECHGMELDYINVSFE